MSTQLPFSLIIKPVGSQCNLRCSYCYYINNDRQHKMTIDVLSEMIAQHIQAQPEHTSYVDFIWHGGEPMMRGLSFYESVVSEQKKLKTNKKIKNTLQTNGTLITEAWATFFADNNFMIGISIDGPELVHNIGRIDKRGDSSYEKTIKGLALLNKYNVEFNTLTVINNRSFHRGKEIYRSKKEQGCTYLQFQPCIDHELDRISDHDWSLSGSQWGTFLCDVFDEWCIEDIGTTYVQFFENCLAILMDYPSQMCHHAPTCGQQLIAEANGEVFSCDHFAYQSHSLGQCTDPSDKEYSSLKEMVNSSDQREFGENKRNQLAQQCLSCDFLPLCNGGCPKNRTLSTQHNEPLNSLCIGYKQFFHYALPRLLKMVDAMKNGYSPMCHQLF
ncbi:anaerobic sulfatase maturase [Alginatibacterium sediminis]|uniref:Anaerobic sulfatase maturase n=1 Tax=Alginatibacterium sediminis TaxID=2164068 RepID=A0A420EH11_9ALTE|nr:anaerobic sulfatase maturase [Alginatibacterium sediminis]RKF19963.1 anaerobic sulfatase maturase [Alginatibacterium sediminis]